ncbi:unnamed protein product, partial [Mesorhabditis spiculigera]
MLVILSLVCGLFVSAFGRRECIGLSGQLSCANDHRLHAHIEVTVWDADFFLLNPVGYYGWNEDDMMGITYTSEKGEFLVYGCADDPDFLPVLINNRPDPYLTFRHYCNSLLGEKVKLQLPQVFMPTMQELGVIRLERNETRAGGRFGRALRQRKHKHVG